MGFSFLVLLALSRCAATIAARLFAASFAGNVTTLSLTQGPSNNFYAVDIISASTACAPNPSWITLDKSRNLLYCSERSFEGVNGSLNILEIHEDGSLVPLDKITTPIGSVASSLYANNTAIVVAYYSSSSMGSYDITNSGNVKILQSFTYTPNTNHTESHPHDAVVDPTSSFVIIPDLGSDLLRAYYIDPATKLLETLPPFSTPYGSGPRHAKFLVLGSKTYLYVVFELGNLVIVYDITYYDQTQTLGLTQIFETSLLRTPNGTELQQGSFAAEIQISPDKNFIVVSQRNDSFFSITNPSATLAPTPTLIPSDSLFTFAIDHSNGHLKLLDLAPAGGAFPRHFSMNKAGDLLAVGLQNDDRVVFMTRDVATGKIGDIVAAVDLPEVICLVWDE